jgi:hypothetical protein
MFTWICPQCGREVPPAYDECPDCSGKGAGQAPPQQPGQGVPMGAPPPPSYPPQPQYAQPPQTQYPQPPAQYAPPRQFAPTPQYAQPPQYAQAPQYAPPAGQAPAVPRFMPAPATGISLPPWLMSIGFAVLFLAVGAALFFGIKHFNGSSEASASTSTSSPQESAPTPAAAKKNSTLQKYVEVTGLRLTESSGKAVAHFVVVNHSGAEIADLSANVNLWARTAKSDEEAVGTFTFKIASLGAYESKDLTMPVNTKLKVYELPDWQNLTAELQITSPE